MTKFNRLYLVTKLCRITKKTEKRAICEKDRCFTGLRRHCIEGRWKCRTDNDGLEHDALNHRTGKWRTWNSGKSKVQQRLIRQLTNRILTCDGLLRHQLQHPFDWPAFCWDKSPGDRDNRARTNNTLDSYKSHLVYNSIFLARTKYDRSHHAGLRRRIQVSNPDLY